MVRDLTRETSIALAAAREAGALALGLQGSVDSRDKADGSPVSDADLGADAILRAHLGAHFPDDAILSEEGVEVPGRLQSRRLWIIDPIDGTKDYLAGLPGWAVQVALVDAGDLVLGVLVIPREGVVLVGLPGVGGTAITPEGTRELRVHHDRESVLIGSKSTRNRESMDQVRQALPEFSSIDASCVGVKAWRMIQGKADLYVHARPINEWDVAAPAAVLIAAGGQATDLSGHAFRFNQPVPLVPGLLFSTREDHGLLARRLKGEGIHVP